MDDFNNTKVSVIMPAYNAEKYIGEAIDSILNQTYRNFELCIVEDCSTDRTRQVIKERNDNRIRYIQNDRNYGIAYSTNRGIAESDGVYIALLDDDDIAMPKRLASQVNYMKCHPEIDILGGKSIDIDADGRTIRHYQPPRNNPRYIKAILLFQCMDFRNGTTMIRRQFWEENNLSYKNYYRGMQDYRFFMEASKVGCISAINKVLLKWRLHDHNETLNQMQNYADERASLYEKIQKDSITMSGFRLDKEDFSIIHKAFAEENGKCDTPQEWEKLYLVMKKMLKQGHEMQIDYQFELEHFLKKKMAEFLVGVDFGSCKV